MRYVTLISAVVVLCAAVFLHVGCSTDATGPGVEDQEFQNPYDWAGESHNRCLGYVIDRVVSDPLRDWRNEDVFDLVLQYFAREGDGRMMLCARRTGAEFQRIADLSAGGRLAYFSFLDSLENIGAVSETCITFSKRLFDVVERLNCERLEAIAVEIDASDLSPEEEAILFLQVSIAKHSARFCAQTPRQEALPDMIAPAAIIVGMDLIGGGVGAYLAYRSGNSASDILINGLLIGAGTSAVGWLGKFL